MTATTIGDGWDYLNAAEKALLLECNCVDDGGTPYEMATLPFAPTTKWDRAWVFTSSMSLFGPGTIGGRLRMKLDAIKVGDVALLNRLAAES